MELNIGIKAEDRQQIADGLSKLPADRRPADSADADS
jgi:hypothetical protein